MSQATTRAALAAALSTVDGVTGYVKRPTTPKPGDGWPLWRGSERGAGWAFTAGWAVLIVLPGDEAAADAWIDAREAALFEALEPVMFVDRLDPAAVPVAGTDAFALMITGRSE